MKEKIILPFIILVSISIFGMTIFSEYMHFRIIGTLFLLIGISFQYILSKKTITIYRAPEGVGPPKNSSEGDLFITYKK